MARRAQTTLNFRARGGRRRGAGRKPKGLRPGVPHTARPDFTEREPVLVTLKVRPEVWNLRSRRALTRILRGLDAAKERHGARIVQFSVQRDHVHLIVEASERMALARSVQGLSVRLARALNRMMQRRGAVFADRYHGRVLRTPRQVRHAIAYVLCNARKHGLAPRAPGWLDPCSSARAFDGWRGQPRPAVHAPIVEPRSWLLRVGWRRLGLLDPDHVPGTRPA